MGRRGCRTQCFKAQVQVQGLELSRLGPVPLCLIWFSQVLSICVQNHLYRQVSFSLLNNTSLSTRPLQHCLPGKAMLHLGSFDATRVILARKSCCYSNSARSSLLGNISAICKALARWPLSSATSSTARRVWRVVRTAMSHARHCYPLPASFVRHFSPCGITNLEAKLLGLVCTFEKKRLACQSSAGAVAPSDFVHFKPVASAVVSSGCIFLHLNPGAVGFMGPNSSPLQARWSRDST